MGCGSSGGAEDPFATNGTYTDEFDGRPRSQSYYKKASGDNKEENGDFFEVEDAQGEEFMAVRPWLGAIAEPTNHNPPNPSKPDIRYELEYVYGYRCQDSR